MSYNPNRLQFVHCDTCFENSEKAREYVNGNLITRDRPSLYAEPMVLKYGDPNNPNILLAIGSVGDGKTTSVNNKVFFIDCAQLDIDNNFEFIDSNTIAFNINKNENGTIIKTDVMLQPSKVVDKAEYDNIILNEPNGLFACVNTEVVDDEIVVNINGTVKKYALPDPVVKGVYNKEKLTLTLQTKKSESIVIDFNDVVLISDNDNNIIKKREDGLYAKVELDFDKSTDVLTFNNGLEEKTFNLLSTVQDDFNNDTTAELKRLHLTSVASKSIKNTIQKLDSGTTIESNMLLSVDASNLIKITDGGVYASVDLAYDNALNKLTLTTSNGKKEFSLTNQSFLESISYDSVQKKIILRVKLSNNDIVVQEIGVSDLFNPINVENISNSPIVLEKTSNDITGIDTVSAKLNVVASDDNLLKVLTDGSTATLFASNHAEDIMVDWYTVDKNGDITDPERIGVQEGFIRTVRYLNDNTAINDEVKEKLVIAYERISTLEAEVAELTDYVKKLTNFGYTEDLFVDENQTNA